MFRAAISEFDFQTTTSSFLLQTHQTKFIETDVAGEDVLPLDAGVPGTFGCNLANRPQVS